MVLKKDLLMITCLRQDARQTLTDISRKIRIPISTIYDRLRYQENDIIVRHTTLLDFTKLGFNARVVMALKVERNSRDDIEQYLRGQGNINSLYKINNGYDFLIEGIFRHLKDFQEFVEGIEHKFPILEKQLFYIVDDMKREAFLSDPDHLESCG